MNAQHGLKRQKNGKSKSHLDKNRGSHRISGQDRDHCENIKLDLSCSLTKSNTNGGDISSPYINIYLSTVQNRNFEKFDSEIFRVDKISSRQKNFFFANFGAFQMKKSGSKSKIPKKTTFREPENGYKRDKDRQVKIKMITAGY